MAGQRQPPACPFTSEAAVPLPARPCHRAQLSGSAASRVKPSPVAQPVSVAPGLNSLHPGASSRSVPILCPPRGPHAAAADRSPHPPAPRVPPQSVCQPDAAQDHVPPSRCGRPPAAGARRDPYAKTQRPRRAVPPLSPARSHVGTLHQPRRPRSPCADSRVKPGHDGNVPSGRATGTYDRETGRGGTAAHAAGAGPAPAQREVSPARLTPF